MSKVIYKYLIIILIIGISTGSLCAQVTESKIKALYIYQIAQQVEWANHNQINTYYFGVLSNDNLLSTELTEIANTSKFKSKPFKIVNIRPEFHDNRCHVLFIDASHVNKIGDLSKLYAGNQVLLISYMAEDKLFTMVNLYKKVNENTITYEINRENIENQGFLYSPELLAHGGSLMDLKALYLSSAKELKQKQDELLQTKSELEQIIQEKENFQRQVVQLRNNITIKEKEFASLSTRVSEKDSTLRLKQKELEIQRELLINLENDLLNKQVAVKLKETDLENLNYQYESNLKLIADQTNEINKQKIEIEAQDFQINTQTETISTQRIFIFLLAILGIVFIGAIIAINAAFRLRKQMNTKLKILVDKRTQELNISKEYYRTLAEYSPVPLFEVNVTKLLTQIRQDTSSDFKISQIIKNNSKLESKLVRSIEMVDLNIKAKELFEADDFDVFKEGFHGLFINNNTEFFIKGFESLRNNENTYTNEANFETFTGKKLKTMVTWILLPESLGEQNHLLIAVHDITKIKEYETELMMHRDNLEALVRERAKEIVDLNKQLTTSNQTLNSKNQELETQTLELERALKLLKQTQKQLVESEKMASLGMLTAGVAHEINNPINFINSGSQALRLIIDDFKEMLSNIGTNENFKDSNIDVKLLNNLLDEELLEKTDMVIESIDDGVNRTIEIVNSLRAYSYDSTESFQLYSIEKAVENSVLILQNKLKGKVEIIKEIEQDIEIECLPGKINQVFVNVLSNAVDSIDKKGSITINVSSDIIKNMAVISIKDTGCGIEKSKLNKIFEPFYTTKEVGTGTGLGLYISYGIISQHDGELNIDSEVGTGTIVEIKLPINHND